MPLNKQKGDMYGFIKYTWNAIKGLCPHDCSYCYMKKWKRVSPPRIDTKEFLVNLHTDGYIFVGTGIDMFADDIPSEWIQRTLNYLHHFPNRYLFQTKNPKRFYEFEAEFPPSSDFCITMESNRHYPEIMRRSPPPEQRVKDFIRGLPGLKMITIEPILDYDFMKFADMIHAIKPYQVNIGADSGNNKLPEPEWGRIQLLIDKLKERHTLVHIKPNLERLRSKE
jgi:hypothetical protein